MDYRNLSRVYQAGRRIIAVFRDIKGDELDRQVALIWNDLSSYELSAVIDIHTDSGNSFPYVLVDRVIGSNDRLRRASWELANETGLFSIWEYRLNEYQQYRLDRSLRERFWIK